MSDPPYDCVLSILLDAAMDPSIIPSLQDLFLKDCALASVGYIFTFTGFQGPIADRLLNSSSCSLFLGILSPHHISSGIYLITSGFLAGLSFLGSCINYNKRLTLVPLKLDLRRTHQELWINLLFLASNSIALAHHIYALPIYPYLCPDYVTVLCLVHHHLLDKKVGLHNHVPLGHVLFKGVRHIIVFHWHVIKESHTQGGFLIIGSTAHASIFIIGDHHACFLGGRIEM